MEPTHPDRKQKIKHELKEMLALFLYLAFFFCALVTYKMLLLAQYNVEEYWNFAAALITAAVVTKVILIGEYARLGRRFEHKRLLLSAMWKAFIFSLLVFAFHVAEEIIKGLIHGTDIAQTASELRFDQFASRWIIVFVTFVPLFAFREIRRVIGEEEFQTIVFAKNAKTVR
jgi:hypothetical protein